MKKTSLRLFAALVLVYSVIAHAAVTVTVNGSNHSIPQTNEKGWGNNVTAWIQAISANTLQPSGGAFTLTADTDFGANFGLKSIYLKSRATNPAGSGVLRLGNAETIGWRNNANDANLLLTVNSSDQLTYNGVLLASSSGPLLQDSLFTIFDDADSTKKLAFQLSGITTGNTRTLTVPDASTTIVGTDTTQTLTNKTLTAPVISSISNTGTLTLPTATDTLVGRATTDTLTNKTINADSNTITNIENADIKAGAAIARSKLASGTASHVVINDGSGVFSSEAQLAISRGGTGTSTANAALNAFLPTQSGNTGKVLSTDGSDASWTSVATDPMTTLGDIIYHNGSAAARLAGPTTAAPFFLTQTGTGSAGAAPAWRQLKVPNIVRYTSTPGVDYTPTAGTAWIEVTVVGGGGGGSASGTASVTAGGAGASSFFKVSGGATLIECGGGAGGLIDNAPSVGGTVSTLISPAIQVVSVSGGSGGPYTNNQSGATETYSKGGDGGNSIFGGGGSGGSAGFTSRAGVSNTGAGGGGAGAGLQVSNRSGGGGGAGAGAVAIIPNPSGTYQIQVGAGGVAGSPAGTDGFVGAAGGSGVVIIKEFFQ